MRRFDRESQMAAKESTKGNTRYILTMFPYPSGRLHLGHVRIYVSGDLLTRFSKLLSNHKNSDTNHKHVINPMGFDSFGLPAENAARDRGLDPAAWTNSNIRVMKKQMDDLGLQFQWREATSNPSYYKWTQEIFLRLFDANLVYKSYAQVNWDPVDKTVLADEQVDEDGRSWRSGALVQKRTCRQWFIKVNAFTDDIYRAEDVDPQLWGDILSIQRNWIQKPSGWMFYLPININNSERQSTETLLVFTKEPELFLSKSTKLLIPRDHWLEKIYKISQIGYIKNPFSNDRLAVEFTEKEDELPPNCRATLTSQKERAINNFVDETISRKQVILNAKLNNLGGFFTSHMYRDWLISRQRFWGTPVPIIRTVNGQYTGVSRESLPVTLPKIDSYIEGPQSNYQQEDDTHDLVPTIMRLAPKDWLEVRDSSGELIGTRECDTLDTLFDSSWYFLRYATSPCEDKPFDADLVQPVWCYVGGKEHAAMHLFYARFMTHFLHSCGCIDFKEPFRKLLVQGIVKGQTYKLHGKYLSKEQVDALADKSSLTVGYEKMSKSKGNGVDPQDLLDRFGIDATRFCLMSYANPRTERIWRSTSEEFKDILIFLRRVVLTVQEYVNIGKTLQKGASDNQNPIRPRVQELDAQNLETKTSSLDVVRNRCSIESIIYIQETNQFRQYISTMHVLLNVLRSNVKTSAVYSTQFAKALASLIIILNPVAPHLSEELWLHFSRCIINPLKDNSEFKINMQASDQSWPLPDDNYPRRIKIRPFELDAVVESLVLSKDELSSLDEDGIIRLVESHFESKGDRCRVLNVQKFADLSATVEAIIQSVIIREKQKRVDKKKKSPSLESANTQ